MKKINWGILGLGNIADRFAESFATLDNAIIKGVASNNINKLDNFKTKYNIPSEFCFNDYNKLILSSEIDIIYIALPNSLHAKHAAECLNRNKNVLLEKPAFLRIKDFENIKKLSLEKKCYFTEAFMYRYLPYFKELKNIIENKTLGNVCKIESNFNIRVFKEKKILGIKFKKPDYSNRLFNKELGGGSIFDLGCYPLSLSTFINSISHKISKDNIKLEKIETEFCDSGVDIKSSAIINFNNKFNSFVQCSFKDKMCQNTKITFELGNLFIEETWAPSKDTIIEIQNGDSTKILNFKNDGLYSYEIQEISNQLLNKYNLAHFPSIMFDEIEINTLLLNNWANIN